MIDKIMGYRSTKRDVLVNDTYTPGQAVVGSQLSISDNSKILTVLFPPWHGGGKAFEVLAKRLVKHGSSVLSYSFSGHILEPNVEQVLASFRFIQGKATEDIQKLDSQYKFQEINAIGASLGNAVLAYVAREFNDFSKVTMLVAGSSLARVTWEGSRTQSLRTLLQEQGVTEKALEKAWSTLAPRTNAVAFKNTKVNMWISSSDKIIPTVYQRDMEKALKEISSNVTTHTTRLGHYATVGRFCYFGNLK